VTVAAPVRAVPIRFTIGARTLFALPRRLVRVPLTLAEAREARVPSLPPLPAGAHGYLVTSLPEAGRAALMALAAGMIAFERQRYTRYHVDLAPGFDAWFGALSGNARQGLKRKAKKVATASGGALDIVRYRSADELAAFHAVACALSQRTYQARLLGAGLPETAAFRDEMARLGAADMARGWLLRIGGAPAAYLYCPVEGDTVIYAHVGHDPAFNELSPGAVLQLEALRDLFAERRFGWFDFTEGEGQHKRQMASGGTACVDLLLLRPTIANRLVIAGLGAFDGAVALAKRGVRAAGAERLFRTLRRG
jgi:CelD/BcsL family acetyltransferase involved in cellulose biosynthesis